VLPDFVIDHPATDSDTKSWSYRAGGFGIRRQSTRGPIKSILSLIQGKQDPKIWGFIGPHVLGQQTQNQFFNFNFEMILLN